MTASRNRENLTGQVCEAHLAIVQSTSSRRARSLTILTKMWIFFTLFDSAECPREVKDPRGVHVKI